jgi:hypothetical protein
MRIADLDRSLPNGFHDATLHSISARPDEGILEFGLQVSIGDPEGTPEEQERYRPARLVLTGVTYFFIDPPGSRRDTWASRASRIDLCDSDPAVSQQFETSGSSFAGRFFVTDWNAFIHFAAVDATLVWTDGV